jgi:hypothetical protein
MAIDIGRIVHQAYREQSKTNCICIDRAWEDLPKQEADAWRHAACAVLKYLDQCKQDMEDGVIG